MTGRHNGIVTRVKAVAPSVQATGAFLENRKSSLAEHFRDESWVVKLAYLSHILQHENALNLSIQGKSCNAFQVNDKIMALKKKLSVCSDRVNWGVYDMFDCLSSLADVEGVCLGPVTAIIVQHLTETLRHFEEYFPSKSHILEKQWVRDPFNNAENSDLPPVMQDKLLEPSCDSGLQSRFS